MTGRQITKEFLGLLFMACLGLYCSSLRVAKLIGEQVVANIVSSLMVFLVIDATATVLPCFYFLFRRPVLFLISLEVEQITLKSEPVVFSSSTTAVNILWKAKLWDLQIL